MVNKKFAIYARVSKTDQVLENQINPLVAYCERMGWEYEIFTEKESTRKSRPVQWALYNRLLKKEFDGLLFYKLDRWARSLKELVTHMEALYEKGVILVSFMENIDLSTSTGNLMMNIMGSFAEFERDIIRERTMAGLDRAKQWGKIGGRHPKNCGCGARDKKGNKHDGYMKPIRDSSNKLIGWEDQRKQTPPVQPTDSHTINTKPIKRTFK